MDNFCVIYEKDWRLFIYYRTKWKKVEKHCIVQFSFSSSSPSQIRLLKEFLVECSLPFNCSVNVIRNI